MMKNVAFLLALLCFFFLLLDLSPSSAAHLQYDTEDLASEESLLKLFENWAVRHRKNYTKVHHHDRFHIFKDNLFYIHSHNNHKNSIINEHQERASHVHRLGLNRFADLTLDEFKTKHLGFHITKKNHQLGLRRHTYSSINSKESLPLAVDWREKGAVTPVKDQGQCGKSSL